MAIFDVLEKTPNDRRWNHVAYVLRDVPAVALEGDADHLAVLEHGSAAVARVYRRIDLHGQMGVHAGVRIGLKVDA